jgi:hypothetical protein
VKDDDENVEKTLAKIIDLAIARGALAQKDRKGAIGQALLHHGDKRAFLRKLLERRGRLTADEALSLEKEALAPPPPPPPSKPLPNLMAKKSDPSRRKSSRRLLSPSPLPSLNTPGASEKKKDEGTVYKGGLPSLSGKKKPDEEE